MSKLLVNLAQVHAFSEYPEGAVTVHFTDGITETVLAANITVFGHGEQLVREWLKGLDSKTEEG